MSDKKEVIKYTLPEGRVINASLFEKDTFVSPKGEKAVPKYKLEIAFEPDALLDFLDQPVFDFLIDAIGDEDYVDAQLVLDPRDKQGEIQACILDGNVLARKREKKGKEGDAYKGKLVIRTDTLYNLHGDDAPGGIAVYDADVSAVDPMDKSKIYSGMYGMVAVTLHHYKSNDDEDRFKFYLAAFQKTRDGEKLSSGQDSSNLFKPQGDGGGARTRRTRKARD